MGLFSMIILIFWCALAGKWAWIWGFDTRQKLFPLEGLQLADGK